MYNVPPFTGSGQGIPRYYHNSQSTGGAPPRARVRIVATSTARRRLPARALAFINGIRNPATRNCIRRIVLDGDAPMVVTMLDRALRDPVFFRHCLSKPITPEVRRKWKLRRQLLAVVLRLLRDAE